jgi:hypothetical protein
MTGVSGVRIVLRIADGWVPPRLDEDGHHVLGIDTPTAPPCCPCP